ncbi:MULTISPECIES: helix-turn-helix domain-containing protein [Klebsiella/Raoultella group]|uniref:helix-turn-helix domain-containing protein n=1 Tax=Klebsiella/Raoultella group TaxID=2890311 RepID=UPI000A1C9DA4|nr:MULTISPECIES: LuxR C-terminal-related transcriptional regulator [Klebsiella/Raoultella group]MBZ7213081.1 helix-turn-helix transcriptional regulator [Klebsiella grimontii]MEB7549218.1 LuxR C-terminal-related transcriptional regulator [Klebsiella grimontii]MEB8018954.1 LuxR C-terminal-related transcriptional regulator [Raoultella ornithinolytica]HDH7817527.1 helix-turn-helix transcriptional regulator [Raoultella ornithinolytica]
MNFSNDVLFCGVDFIMYTAVQSLLADNHCEIIGPVSSLNAMCISGGSLLVIKIESNRDFIEALVTIFDVNICMPVLIIDFSLECFLIGAARRLNNVSIISGKSDVIELNRAIKKTIEGVKYTCELTKKKQEGAKPSLSTRELRILLQFYRGELMSTIAMKNNCAIKTVYTHIANIKKKMNVSRRAELYKIFK